MVTVSANHSTMNRKGFVPYGPSRSGAEALARVMAADLTGSDVTANILLPGGATATGMVPDDFPPEQRDAASGPAGHGTADPLSLLGTGRRGARGANRRDRVRRMAVRPDGVTGSSC